MCSKIVTTLLAAALTLPIVTLAAQSTTTSAEKPLTKAETVEVSATVVAVDPSTRMVTLKGADGKAFDVEAGPAVEHLDQVKPGDVVMVAYTESIAFQVVPKGEESQGVSESASRVAGGREVGRQVTTSFRVASVDPATNILWVSLPNGDTKKIHVEDPAAQQRLKTLSPGNVVTVTYSQSLAVRLEKE